jgi:secreted protein with Ig-like and vWFA domain
MPDRMDPSPAEHPHEAAPVPTEPAANAQPRWRRPTLLVAGASLMTLGVFINFERFETRHVELAADDVIVDESFSAMRHEPEESNKATVHSEHKRGVYAMRGPSDVPSSEPPAESDGVGGLGLVGTGRGGGYVGQAGRASLGHGGGHGYGQGVSGYPTGETNARKTRASRPKRSSPASERHASTRPHPGKLLRQPTYEPRASERSASQVINAWVSTIADPKSTFSIDVDTASYANVRRHLLDGHGLPSPDIVRTEELINYFSYDYKPPAGDAPFSVTTEVGPCPWNAEHRLVHVGLQGKEIKQGSVPPRNLVFLIDVSGSMYGADRLDLVKHGLAALTKQLNKRDRVSIVVYAGAAGVVLQPTSGADKPAILEALGRLESGGSTNGGAGIEMAYRLAEDSFIKGGVNRVLLATDGDFNVGVSSRAALIDLIETKRESGVFLSVLGVGYGNLRDNTMEQLADKGNGNYSYLDSKQEAHKVLVEESAGTLVTIAKDVKIQVDFDPELVEQHRLIGYENRVLAHHEFADDRKDAGEIGAGHSVTAIYEIAPTSTSGTIGDDPLLVVNLRYKQPDGQRSRLLTVPVRDHGRTLAEASEDYRFSAAVAAFGEALRGAQGPSYAAIHELAAGALGADSHGYRKQFLELVAVADQLTGEGVVRPAANLEPEPELEPSRVNEPEVEAPVEIVELQVASTDERDRQTFVLEVLRLLPPLLGLPLFIMALRRPRGSRARAGAPRSGRGDRR